MESDVLHAEYWEGAFSAFSASYVSVDPEGEHLRVIITPDVADPCADLYSDENRVRDLDFWFMMVETGQRGAGSYEVVNAGELAPDEATVTLTRAISGQKAVRRDAVRGRVVTGNPEWETGASLSVQVDAEFPKQLVNTVECTSAVPLDEGLEAIHTCLCERPNGAQFECENQVGIETCCHADLEAGTIPLSTESTAHFCPAMCNAVVGLENSCWRLR